MNWIISSTLLLWASANIQAFTATISQNHTAPDTIVCTIPCMLEPHEMLLHSSISFSCNSPQVSITEWHADKTPCTFFDPLTKKSHPAYTDHVTLTVTARVPEGTPLTDVKLHLHYHVNTEKNPAEKIFSLGSSASDPLPEPASTPRLSVKQRIQEFSQGLFSWIQDKELPLGLKFLLAFIIGIFMSLTPCIYPMIPITIGLLHGNKRPSIGRSFLLAFVYTCGISFTFAVLGFLAAFAGAQFGSLMSNPWVIIPIVIMFAYLGFSMLGFYDMYTPSFMRSRSIKHEGSFVSAFMFGLINGTVASPCLSPGLALILGIVAQMANKFLGFLLLFVFGIGSSLPLLIIGTFSSALSVLPRAGMWMIEFKKVFGFMLLGMCLYYVRSFMDQIDSGIFFIALGVYLLAVGIYYVIYGLQHRSRLAQCMGIILFVCSALSFVEYGKYYLQSTAAVPTQPFNWQTGYTELRDAARRDGKPLLLYFTATWCSVCSTVEKRFFGLPVIQKEVPQRVVPVKIDCTNAQDEAVMALTKKFHVAGYPTYLLIDPATETVIRTWYADIAEKSPEAFIKELKA